MFNLNNAHPLSMQLNISQAARAAGVSRGTIYNRIKNGLLSAHKADDGLRYVDAAELHRCFPKADQHAVSAALGGVSDVQDEQTPPVKADTAELDLLRQQNRMLTDQLRKAEERERDLIELMKGQQRLLQAPQQRDPETPNMKKRWWKFTTILVALTLAGCYDGPIGHTYLMLKRSVIGPVTTEIARHVDDCEQEARELEEMKEMDDDLMEIGIFKQYSPGDACYVGLDLFYLGGEYTMVYSLISDEHLETDWIRIEE